MPTTLELFEARAALKSQMDDLKGQIDKINAELEKAYLQKAKDALAFAGKDFGTVTLVDGNTRLKANVVKKVEWDQEKLSSAFDQMTIEEARHYAKVTLSVEERKYTSAPPNIQRVLEPCRTTSVGRFTVEMKEED